MFTGIITNIGEVDVVKALAGGRDITIKTTWSMTDVKLGDSIACSGICLTVTEKGEGRFKVHASAETLSLTTITTWQIGSKINLERALKVGDEIGGHFVSGHVDGVTELVEMKRLDASYELKLKVPDVLSRYISRKGSVTLDGVSLTVNSVDADIFTVNIIPYTFGHTTFQFKQPGDFLNVEVDLIARYLERIVEARA